uniref:Uncharacterized protein n=1 Tax=Lotharella globosa TaxID=91324 RepID=A0A6V3KE39_9EUKA
MTARLWLLVLGILSYAADTGRGGPSAGSVGLMQAATCRNPADAAGWLVRNWQGKSLSEVTGITETFIQACIVKDNLLAADYWLRRAEQAGIHCNEGTYKRLSEAFREGGEQAKATWWWEKYNHLSIGAAGEPPLSAPRVVSEPKVVEPRKPAFRLPEDPPERKPEPAFTLPKDDPPAEPPKPAFSLPPKEEEKPREPAFTLPKDDPPPPAKTQPAFTISASAPVPALPAPAQSQPQASNTNACQQQPPRPSPPAFTLPYEAVQQDAAPRKPAFTLPTDEAPAAAKKAADAAKSRPAEKKQRSPSRFRFPSPQRLRERFRFPSPARLRDGPGGAGAAARRERSLSRLVREYGAFTIGTFGASLVVKYVLEQSRRAGAGPLDDGTPATSSILDMLLRSEQQQPPLEEPAADSGSGGLGDKLRFAIRNMEQRLQPDGG